MSQTPTSPMRAAFQKISMAFSHALEPAKQTDPLRTQLQNWVANNPGQYSLTIIIRNALGQRIQEMDRTQITHISQMLRHLNCTNREKRIRNRRIRIWTTPGYQENTSEANHE